MQIWNEKILIQFRKVKLSPLKINDDNIEIVSGNGDKSKQKQSISGDQNIKQYINQFESVLSPVSTASISYSTINPNLDQNNNQISTPKAIINLTQNDKINTDTNLQNKNFQFYNSTNASLSQSPYSNNSISLAKQMTEISNQTERYFKSPKNIQFSDNITQKNSISINQQIWRSPQNQIKQPEIVTEKQIIYQELKNKILFTKFYAKDTTFLDNQMKEKYESGGGYAFEYMEEKNAFVLKYYVHLIHEEIERLIQKKKNILLSRNTAFCQFLTQFICGNNKNKIILKDEYDHLLQSAIDMKEIISKDIALLFKNLEKENNYHQSSPNKHQNNSNMEENNTNYQTLNQIISPKSKDTSLSHIPNEIKQLLVKANVQISNLQNELDIEKQKNKLHIETQGLEDNFENELKNLKIQNNDLKKQIQELTSENKNLLKKYSENDKLCKLLKEETIAQSYKLNEKIQRLDNLQKDFEDCKISLQQIINAQQNEKASFNIAQQERDVKYNILNERNILLEERIKCKDDLLQNKDNEIQQLQQKQEDLNNLKDIKEILADVDRKDHNLVTNLICLINKFENNELPRNTKLIVIKYLEQLNIICKLTSINKNTEDNIQNQQKDIGQLKRQIKIKCINNSTLHLLNCYMQKLMDKIIKQQVLHEELIWFKDNIERLVEKFLQMSKNQISFNHIDFFKEEIQIKYDRIQQKISQISPDISQLEAEMQEIATDQVNYIKNDFEDSTDDDSDIQNNLSSNQLLQENSMLKMKVQNLNSQIQQLNKRDQILQNSIKSNQSQQSQQ